MLAELLEELLLSELLEELEEKLPLDELLELDDMTGLVRKKWWSENRTVLVHRRTMPCPFTT
jgi:hypothetical protein